MKFTRTLTPRNTDTVQVASDFTLRFEISVTAPDDTAARTFAEQLRDEIFDTVTEGMKQPVETGYAYITDWNVDITDTPDSL